MEVQLLNSTFNRSPVVEHLPNGKVITIAACSSKPKCKDGTDNNILKDPIRKQPRILIYSGRDYDAL